MSGVATCRLILAIKENKFVKFFTKGLARSADSELNDFQAVVGLAVSRTFSGAVIRSERPVKSSFAGVF